MVQDHDLRAYITLNSQHQFLIMTCFHKEQK